MKNSPQTGFTLIELSIVLVIIGLIVGGILVGQNLIAAAAVRAQISQIEKFNTAVNTFYGKYGYLPGNMPETAASQYGFSTRTNGVGTGNGILLGGYTGFYPYGWTQGCGEVMLFWTDLSTAGLIDGGFTLAATSGTQGCVANNSITATSTPQLSAYYPFAKIGGGNYIYVWSGGPNGSTTSDGNNYFGVEVINSVYNRYIINSNSPGFTVSQAYNIDTKMDDGLPQSGRVTASGLNGSNGTPSWMGGTTGAFTYAYGGPNPGTATPGGPTTCYDNGNNGSNPMQYSMEISNGAYVNCVLSFKFQ